MASLDLTWCLLTSHGVFRRIYACLGYYCISLLHFMMVSVDLTNTTWGVSSISGSLSRVIIYLQTSAQWTVFERFYSRAAFSKFDQQPTSNPDCHTSISIWEEPFYDTIANEFTTYTKLNQTKGANLPATDNTSGDRDPIVRGVSANLLGGDGLHVFVWYKHKWMRRRDWPWIFGVHSSVSGCNHAQFECFLHSANMVEWGKLFGAHGPGCNDYSTWSYCSMKGIALSDSMHIAPGVQTIPYPANLIPPSSPPFSCIT